MKKYSFEKLLSELKKVRLFLKIYTILHILAILILFTSFAKIGSEIISGTYIVFILFFIFFIWFRLPMSTYDKIGETFLILIFGLFALWMWIPNEKRLKEMVHEYNTTHNNVYN